ncbi:MAG: O-antigen ligase family protein [Planctomycetaceae bacterium]|nr:O-antigen ligase family protein [Planctomycetaceae bacterium]
MSTYLPHGWEGLFSGRGYIWTRTLEIFRRNPWFGTGPGTFAMAFPNDDILNKYRFTQNMDEDKGHGIWASFLVQLGLVGVMLYTLPVVYIVYKCWRRGGALAPVFLAGMGAFILSSLTNDSTVGVTPVFCVLAGLAMANARAVFETGSGD